MRVGPCAHIHGREDWRLLPIRSERAQAMPRLVQGDAEASMTQRLPLCANCGVCMHAESLTALARQTAATDVHRTHHPLSWMRHQRIHWRARGRFECLPGFCYEVHMGGGLMIGASGFIDNDCAGGNSPSVRPGRIKINHIRARLILLIG